jgi:hypothetical protein
VTAPRLRQCKTCPWRVDADPYAIPNGYSVERHRTLASTIAGPDSKVSDPLHAMACHYSPVDAEYACVGWIHHEVQAGHNLPLRLALFQRRIDYVTPIAPQHERFEDTLPRDDENA